MYNKKHKKEHTYIRSDDVPKSHVCVFVLVNTVVKHMLRESIINVEENMNGRWTVQTWMIQNNNRHDFFVFCIYGFTIRMYTLSTVYGMIYSTTRIYLDVLLSIECRTHARFHGCSVRICMYVTTTRWYYYYYIVNVK